MDRQSLRVLEFPQIVTFLQALTATEPGRRVAGEIFPSTDREEIETWLGQVTELKEMVQTGNPLPLAGIEPVGEILDRVNRTGQVLSPESLLKVGSTLAATRILGGLAKQCRDRYSRIAELLEALQPVAQLEKKIEAALDHRGRIKDEASRALSRIREEVSRLRERLHKELGEILDQQTSRKTLQERIVTVRNGRLVIPVRSDARDAVDGIVHDTSQSGATSFVEPFRVVPLNNQLSRARSREKEEEARILRELTGAVMAAAEVLRRNERLLGVIDCVQAKVRLSFLLKAREPQLNNGERLRLLGAVHPILALQNLALKPGSLPESLAEVLAAEETANSSLPPAAAEVVPIDLHLPREKSTLIISGSNTGGKTVSLKTLGLLGLMVQAGLHIPAGEGSEWPALSGVFAEIGDEQSLRTHLSTFSARIRRLVNILSQANRRSLILLDEIGTGTDPAEGAAMALAVLDELRSREAFLVVTTHYHLVKAYGVLQAGVENAAVEFDGETGRPTYRLLYGYPGTSNALEIAADLEMPPRVVETARGYLARDERRALDLIQQLEETCRNLQKEREELEQDRRKQEETRVQLSREREELTGSMETVLSQARVQAERLLADAEKELKSLTSRFQQEGARGAAPARRRIREIRARLKAALESPASSEEELATGASEGQQVRLRGVSSSGILVKMKEGGRRAEVQMGPKRVEVDVSALEVLPSLRESGKSREGGNGIRVLRQEPATCRQRLDLVGLRVEDALSLLDKAVDQAVLDGCPWIHIVHGHGTGRLREAVHAFLAGHAAVKDFHPESQDRGGSGVTVVELKD